MSKRRFSLPSDSSAAARTSLLDRALLGERRSTETFLAQAGLDRALAAPRGVARGRTASTYGAPALLAMGLGALAAACTGEAFTVGPDGNGQGGAGGSTASSSTEVTTGSGGAGGMAGGPSTSTSTDATTGTGGGGGSSTSAGGNGGMGGGVGGGSASCVTEADCADDNNVCTAEPDCVAGECVYALEAEGTHQDDFLQVLGNCASQVCDGNGGTEVKFDNTDPLPDGNPCTVDQCDGVGVTSYPPVADGVALPDASQISGDCGKIVCDGAGNTKTDYDTNDPEDDGDDCTADKCVTIGVTSHDPETQGAVCDDNNGLVCNGAPPPNACIIGGEDALNTFTAYTDAPHNKAFHIARIQALVLDPTYSTPQGVADQDPTQAYSAPVDAQTVIVVAVPKNGSTGANPSSVFNFIDTAFPGAYRVCPGAVSYPPDNATMASYATQQNSPLIPLGINPNWTLDDTANPCNGSTYTAYVVTHQ